MHKDAYVVRELAKRVAEVAGKPVQNERRELWRRHNSLERTTPPIYIRAFAFHEVFDEGQLRCEDPFFRAYERQLHELLCRDAIPDDTILEPWITVPAVYDPPVEMRWGVTVSLGEKTMAGGAAAYAPVLLEEADAGRLVMPSHRVNEAATRQRVDRLADAFGDVLEVNLDRSGIFSMWTMDISTDLAKMRGLEQIMWDAYDRPEWLHALLAFMRDAVLKVQGEAEAAGDYSLSCHQNQAMPYARELSDPKPNAFHAQRKDLWGYMAAQEFTTFGPDMFEAFMLQYQIPILAHFGLAAYGCCEDLTHKIDCLRKIPNLRRIAVTPFANLRRCAEQIGDAYVLSWRPNPSDMVSQGLDEAYVRRYVSESLRTLKENGSHFDITLKDVETVRHQPDSVYRWVCIVRDELARCGLG